MITPDWFSDELNILQTHKDLQESILRDITRRILKTDLTVTDTAAWQAEKLQQSGMLYDDIIKEISKRTKMSEAETRQAFNDVETEVFNYDDEVLEKAGYFPKEFKALSPAMMKVLSAAYKKTRKEIKNLTGTTAVTSQTTFIKACDLAHMQIVSGAFTYQEAIRNAIKSAAVDGITVIYPSGYKSSLDAAVRRAVLTGTSQTTGKLVEMRADDMQVDIMELSAHIGARPDHAKWQGKLVSRSGKAGYLSLKDIGYGDVKGFLGANCRHTWFLFFVGISKRNYTDEQLERLNNQTVTYNGEKLPVWQAREKQRAMERSIRVTKQELVMQDEVLKHITGNDKAIMQLEFEKNAVKLKAKEAKLKDFCSQTGLYRDKFREQVFAAETENGIKNWGKSVSQKVVHVNKSELTKQEEKSIIKEIKACGIKGEIILNPKPIDLTDYTFDENHINKERTHNVTRKDAEEFVKTAKLSVRTWKGKFDKYISEKGAVYLDNDEKNIRTAFFKEEFGEQFKNILEVLKKHGR